MKSFIVRTHQHEELIDITQAIQKIATDDQISDGIGLVFIPHTTAAVTINENADPSVKSDIISHLAALIPRRSNFQHMEGNSDAHIKSSLVGSSVQLIIQNGRLRLGTWQGVFFCEFDGPRSREVWVHFIT
jgi:secondary thiamine-phosphate synthase enzyme